MKRGDAVMFKGEEYKVIWIYSNDTCENKKNDLLGEVKLVVFSELKIL